MSEAHARLRPIWHADLRQDRIQAYKGILKVRRSLWADPCVWMAES